MPETKFSDKIKELTEKKEEFEAEARTTIDDEAKLEKEGKAESLRNRLDRLKSKEAAELWYSDKKQKDRGKSESLAMRAIESTTAPVQGIAAVAESALGIGEESSVTEEIKQNIKDNQAFGSVLRKSGAPDEVSMPLGFAMDVALDPLAWMSGGATTLVGRTAKGATKAGAKGALKGAKSRALELASTGSKLGNFMESGQKLSKKLAKKAQKETDEFFQATEGLSQTDAIKQSLDKARETSTNLTDWGKGTLPRRLSYKVHDMINKQKGWIGNQMRTLRHFFSFDRQQFPRQYYSEIVDEAGDVKTAGNALEAELRAGEAANLDNIWGRKAKKFEQLDDDIREALNVKKKDFKQAQEAALGAGEAPLDSMHNWARLDEEVLREGMSKDMYKKINKTMTEEYGVDWIDSITTKVKDSKKAAKLAGAYKDFINMFKIGKIGLSPSAYANAIIGNPLMAHIGGINIARKGYREEIWNAFKLTTGKFDKKNLSTIEQNFEDMISNHPYMFRDLFGVNGKKALSVKELIEQGEKMLDEGIEVIERGELKKAVKGLKEGAEEEYSETVKTLMRAKEKFEEGLQEGLDQAGIGTADELDELTDPVRQSLAENGADRFSIAGEIYDRHTREFVNWLDETIEKGGKTKAQVAKIMKAYMTKPMSMYEKVDQSARLGLAMHLRKNGLSARELTKLQRHVPIEGDDIVRMDNGNFQLSERAAARAASETYLNYKSLPPAIRLLRNMPLAGAPFASFVGAMGDKFARGLMYNPEQLNKVKFFMEELEDTRPQQEEKAMQSKYNKWLEPKPTLRFPFMDNKSAYLDMSYMIPYATLNIFRESDRFYEDSLGGEAAKIIDSVPAFQDPVGQMLLNYGVFPAIYQDASNVRGQFGQRLWPKGADAAEKAKYAGRSALQSVSPSGAALAGPAVGQVLPKKWLPYKMRKLAQAVEGKTAVGYKGRESAASRTARALADTALGLKVYTPNIEYSTE